MGGKPWYKEKYGRQKYLLHGDPVELLESTLESVINEDWVPPTAEEVGLWEDAKWVVVSRDKKREYKITYTEEPERTPWGRFQRTITALHVDRRGFTFTAERSSKEELEKAFWPVVSKLLAHFFSPKISAKPLVFPDL